ncbi:conserved hypothetical protein [Desulfamplus magnetovallimortis]|uniref:Antitoxin n=1 Tax=Desulfamplus magnetovallimortis TaxID=1246637 RepID=A0A1W1HL04_9BACT|nr:hypothetical protein [Desulfamplus magnetovallimortis]SLM33116.1 conserved hypothetical protein [Desulfamplus magnetovallimortis]
MNTVGVQQAISTLPEIIKSTIDNCEETVIVSDSGSVVLIDQREWDNISETLRLFHDKKSLKALIEGHEVRDKGLIPTSITTEEAFYDLQTEYSKKCK